MRIAISTSRPLAPHPRGLAGKLCAVAVLASLGTGAPSIGQTIQRGFVGIRATVTDIRPERLEVDFDVTAFTRHQVPGRGPPYGDPVHIGVTTFNLPGVDFGDGQSQFRTTLPLATVFSGPGPVHAYRRSFTHTYPGPGDYRIRVGTRCFCVSARRYLSRTTAPSVITDYARTPFFPIVTGNAFSSRTAHLTTTLLGRIYRRYFRFLLQLTNTTEFTIQPVPGVPVPTLSEWALIFLGVALACSGAVLLWRQRAVEEGGA